MPSQVHKRILVSSSFFFTVTKFTLTKYYVGTYKKGFQKIKLFFKVLFYIMYVLKTLK